ncbi:LysR substrate-binding domain-containing protein [Nonomuraea sp. NPDC049152]|uniref:LysR substrate-binding domain-containing protein n=1 Tax=Nonomuraea sp. NPDC049152 TaxID=3154350 RepID=UPI0033EB9459
MRGWLSSLLSAESVGPWPCWRPPIRRSGPHATPPRDDGCSGDAPLGVLVAEPHPLAGRRAVAMADLDGQELLWFDRALAPGYYDDVLAACQVAGWVPARIRERAAREALFAAELRHGGDLIALRPAWAAMAGTRWVPLAGEPLRVRHVLAFSPCDLVSDLLREAFPPVAEAFPRGQRVP